MLEDIRVYSSVPAEVVTIAILNNASFHGLYLPHEQKSRVYSSVPAEVVTIAILNYASFHGLYLPYEQKS